MDDSEVLEEIKDSLNLKDYRLDNSVFYVGKNKSSAMVMKTLIEITTKLEEKSLDYSVDHKYNIHVNQK